MKDLTKQEPFSAPFKLDRKTKSTVRYAEQAEGQRPVVGTVYVAKGALAEPYPEQVRVTIEALEEA
jgi:hypothetical protein